MVTNARGYRVALVGDRRRLGLRNSPVADGIAVLSLGLPVGDTDGLGSSAAGQFAMVAR